MTYFKQYFNFKLLQYIYNFNIIINLLIKHCLNDEIGIIIEKN